MKTIAKVLLIAMGCMTVGPFGCATTAAVIYDLKRAGIIKVIPKSKTVVVEGEIFKVHDTWCYRNADEVKVKIVFRKRYKDTYWNDVKKEYQVIENTCAGKETPTLKMNRDKWLKLEDQHEPGRWWHKNRDKTFVITYREYDSRLLSMYPK